jgi:hypothetical protein
MEVSGQFHTPAILTPRYPLDRSVGGPRASLDAVEKRKILPLPGIEPPAVQPAVRRYTNWAISDYKKCLGGVLALKKAPGRSLDGPGWTTALSVSFKPTGTAQFSADKIGMNS